LAAQKDLTGKDEQPGGLSYVSESAV
jgi:hypothetical protein